jgi:hypothetical protein
MTTPNTVVGQPTPQEQAAAGAGQAANPWAEYGLNPDGTPLTVPQKPAPDAEKVTLEAKVAALEAQLAKLPEGFEALSKKVAMVDRLVGALKGEDAQPESGKLQEIWSDLKKVAGSTAPGVEKLLNLLEADPNYLDRLESANAALMAQHVIGVNEKAHGRVLELAKKAGFKAGSDSDLTEMVFPFEQSMTMMINANPELRRAFLSGNVGVIDDIFNRLIKPHVAQRLREKQAKSQAAFNTPKAPPRGGAAPASASEEAPKRNLRTPQGRADFHKQAVAKWLDKASGSDE